MLIPGVIFSSSSWSCSAEGWLEIWFDFAHQKFRAVAAVFEIGSRRTSASSCSPCRTHPGGVRHVPQFLQQLPVAGNPIAAIHRRRIRPVVIRYPLHRRLVSRQRLLPLAPSRRKCRRCRASTFRFWDQVRKHARTIAPRLRCRRLACSPLPRRLQCGTSGCRSRPFRSPRWPPRSGRPSRASAP